MDASSEVLSNTPLTHVPAIFVVGPSSTGKTTLCDALADRLGLRAPAHIKEVARSVMKQTGFSRATVNMLEMQVAIMEGQTLAEAEGKAAVLRGEAPFILSDRCAIDALVYAVLTAEDEEVGKRRWDVVVSSTAFQSALPSYRAALVILLEPVPEWLFDDGIRSLDEPTRCFDTFVTVLRQLAVPYHRLGPGTPDLAKRVDLVLDICKQKMNICHVCAFPECASLVAGLERLQTTHDGFCR
jgi:nicotinamide riboside kinase